MTPPSPDRENEIREWRDWWAQADRAGYVTAALDDLLAALDGVRADHALLAGQAEKAIEDVRRERARADRYESIFMPLKDAVGPLVVSVADFADLRERAERAEGQAVRAASDVVGLRAETTRLRDAIAVYVAEVKRAAEWLASMPDPEQGYDPTVLSALGYMGDLDPGHDENSEIARATLVIREALAACPPATEGTTP